MARFTIELPAELAVSSGRGDRTGASGQRRRGCARDSQDRSDLDAATRGFVSWVACWAGA